MKRLVLSILIASGFTFIGVGSFALSQDTQTDGKMEQNTKQDTEVRSVEKHPQGIQENESEIPTKGSEEESGAEITGKEEYVVKEGDTLAKIAEEFLGSQEKWTVIAEANNIENPDRIYVGQHLEIPSEEGDKSNEPKEEKASDMGGVESTPDNSR